MVGPGGVYALVGDFPEAFAALFSRHQGDFGFRGAPYEAFGGGTCASWPSSRASLEGVDAGNEITLCLCDPFAVHGGAHNPFIGGRKKLPLFARIRKTEDIAFCSVILGN